MKKKFHYTLIVFTSLLALTACTEKELPPPPNPEPPRFYISGNLDGKPFEYTAGLDSCIGDAGMIEDSLSNLRIWWFVFSSLDILNFYHVQLSIVQDLNQSSSLEEALDLAVRPDFEYEYYLAGDTILTSPAVMIEITNRGFNSFISEGMFPQSDSSYFRIRELSEILRNERIYRQVNCSFECQLLGIFSSEAVNLTDGHARVIFGGI